MIGTVFRKANVQKARVQDNTFKVTDLADGKRTVRQLSGLRRDSEIIFVAPKDEGGDIGDDNLEVARGRNGDAVSGSLFSSSSSASGNSKGELSGRLNTRRDTFGLFDRPSMGASVAFRRDSMAATLYAVQNDSTGDRDSHDDDESSDEDRNGHHSAAAAAAGNDDGGGSAFGAIDMFLAGLGLTEYIKIFRRQKIDLDTLMLLTEQNLLEMKIEIGPRKKILKAIEERKRSIMDDEAAIHDSQL